MSIELNPQTQKETNLSKRAMLAALNIKYWSASKHDKRVSDEVAQRHNATVNAGKYRKKLLPQDETPLEKVKYAASLAREFHYKMTLPWAQDGSRILPKDMYFVYVEKMRELRKEFDKASGDFVKQYPTLAEEARTLLGDLYTGNDYPNPAEIEAKFSFDNTFLPFPDEKDFRVEIGEEEVKEIKRGMKRQSQNAVANAMQDAWNRIYEAVQHMSEKLSDPDSQFKNSLVNNLIDLCDVMPRFNIANDPHLDEMVDKIKATLANQKPQELRDNKEIRSNVAAEAAGIVQQMQAFMVGTEENAEAANA